MTESDNQVVDRNRSLYEKDFFAWTVEQAAALRRGAQAGTDPALDWETLAEEVESMGRSQRRALDSALLRIIEHLLKLEYSPAREPRRGWRDTVRAQRIDARDELADSPSLVPRIDLEAVYGKARPLTARTLAENDGIDPSVLPATCPYSLDQVLDDEWWPANRCGLTP